MVPPFCRFQQKTHFPCHVAHNRMSSLVEIQLGTVHIIIITIFRNCATIGMNQANEEKDGSHPLCCRGNEQTNWGRFRIINDTQKGSRQIQNKLILESVRIGQGRHSLVHPCLRILTDTLHILLLPIQLLFSPLTLVTLHFSLFTMQVFG